MRGGILLHDGQNVGIRTWNQCHCCPNWCMNSNHNMFQIQYIRLSHQQMGRLTQPTKIILSTVGTKCTRYETEMYRDETERVLSFFWLNKLPKGGN